MKRKLKLTITKIRREEEKKTVFQRFCPFCRCEVEMLTIAEAVEFLETDAPALDDLIKDGKVHAALTASGSRRICKNSLFQ